MSLKVVFLDIDGVLNHDATRHTVSPTTTEPLPIPIAAECMARLNRLIVETGAKIVISSSWRLFACWQDLGPALVRHGLVGEVIGETPDLPNNAAWLANWQARKGRPFEFDRLERGWEIPEYIERWLTWRPRGLVIAVAQPWNGIDTKFSKNVVRFDGSNFPYVRERMQEIRATAGF